jgi:hypothetical protein
MKALIADAIAQAINRKANDIAGALFALSICIVVRGA